MAVKTLTLDEIWGGLHVLYGGLESVNVEETISDEETAKWNDFFEESVDVLSKISSVIANDLESQKSFYESLLKIFKAKVSKAYGGIFPTSSQFGSALIVPQDIKYNATPSSTYPCYTDYTTNSWNIDLTAGSGAYLLGSASAFYKASPTVGSRAIFGIMKNGIIEIGTTPSFNQFIITTEKTNYPAYNVHALIDQPIETGYKPIYRYNLPFAIPVFYDFGIKLAGMPTVSKTSDVRLIGILFYEHDFKSALKWIT